MIRKIKDCPLIAVLRNGKQLLFTHDVVIKGIIVLELTVETIVEISTEMFLEGYDIQTVSIDETRLDYTKMEVL